MNQYRAQIFVYAQRRLLARKGLKIHTETDAFVYLFIYLFIYYLFNFNICYTFK